MNSIWTRDGFGLFWVQHLFQEKSIPLLETNVLFSAPTYRSKVSFLAFIFGRVDRDRAIGSLYQRMVRYMYRRNKGCGWEILRNYTKLSC